MATSAQRKAIREALIEKGFKRRSATYDSGDGAYTESWTGPAGAIQIAWDPRTHDPKPLVEVFAEEGPR